MEIVVLIISIINLILIISLRRVNSKISRVESLIDEIKQQTDKLGTYTYKSRNKCLQIYKFPKFNTDFTNCLNAKYPNEIK